MTSFDITDNVDKKNLTKQEFTQMLSKEDRPHLTQKWPLSIVRHNLGGKIKQNSKTSSASAILVSRQQTNNLQSSMSSNLPRAFTNNFVPKNNVKTFEKPTRISKTNWNYIKQPMIFIASLSFSKKYNGF